ncbi:MAG: hypothetical protein GQ570_06970 [Helicobacteraceae bacterium]|nr:hypothetical protein [Helicobacteraceae bacterium]
MKGTILDYSIQSSSGIISADDGNRYDFNNSEWKSDIAPSKNQKVDFEIDEKDAIGIYVESSQQFDATNIKESLSELKNSQTVTNAQANVNSALNAGVQNKFGFILSLLTIVALFLPIIQIPYIGSASVMDDFWGKFSFVLLIISAILFYVGAPRLFVKISVGITLIILILMTYDLFSSLNSGSNALSMFSGRRSREVNLFELLKFGFYTLLPLVIILALATFKFKYKEK